MPQLRRRIRLQRARLEHARLAVPRFGRHGEPRFELDPGRVPRGLPGAATHALDQVESWFLAASDGMRALGAWFNAKALHPSFASRAAKRAFVVGHRGSPVRHVENTIESFLASIEDDGADAIETDLCLTADDEVILWHDWDPNDLLAYIRQLGAEPAVAHRPVVPPIGN